MIIRKKGTFAALAIAFFTLFAPQLAGNPTDFLRGKVHFIDKRNLSLEQKLQLAGREFKKLKSGNYFMVGYIFRCWYKIKIDGCFSSREPYRVKHEKGKIIISSSEGKRSFSHGEEEKADVGLLLMNKIEGRNITVTDAELIDPDNTYQFETPPLFWLGKTGTKESMEYLQRVFDKEDMGIRKHLVFIISLHDSPERYDFLKRTALSDGDESIRKNAVFWLGNYRDKKSFIYLKDMMNKLRSAELKKQVVFALYLSDLKEAVKELARIARNDGIPQVRKNAIFWLGQKASTECVKALKDVVEREDDLKLKKQAVFAISQLPKEKSVPLLIDIARTNRSQEVRKNAIFWLSQSGDSRAVKFFEEILLKK
ncbi:MAG: HEAT repeat domain-containing protein [Candidatus Aminicenantales bacterium]